MERHAMRTEVILLAAGCGKRMQAGENKVFLPLCGIPVLCRSVRAFQNLCDTLVLVVKPEDEQKARELLTAYGLMNSVSAIAYGGFERQDSVKNGLVMLTKEDSVVLIHDAARPLVTKEIIERVIAAVSKYGTGVAAVTVKDTIKQVDLENKVISTLDRAQLRAVQTPQGFIKNILLKAHKKAEEQGLFATDDAALVEALGETVQLTEGSYDNLKITTPEDMLMAEAVLNRREGKQFPSTRIGQGYDVHQLVQGRKLILCGVEIPHETGLLGHSDADVALHALTDALLGALALGDIGKHFPDSDPNYKGISSLLLLKHVIGLVKDQGFMVGNADVTIVAQRPKLAPYVAAMRENVAKALEARLDNVSIKATTTEYLGFEGEEKGISAQAVCLLTRG
jgi:2-C-methyl-D-erythritol 4-phosphate cytidylyltransferase / 2-C-methyl-D-erythritol 2,4-cyclodiphosphate synthase